MPFLSLYKDGRILIRIYVQPRASRNAFIGIHDDAVKFAITAPPVDGKANAAVVKYLASFFRIRKKDLEIISGLQSRRKSLLVTGLSEEEIRARMQEVSR